VDETGKKLLRLMFREGERCSPSINQFGYHSLPIENAMDGIVTLVPTPESTAKRKLVWENSFEKVDSSQLLLCALNPIEGYRRDENVVKFRNFLVELDTSSLENQRRYVDSIGLPWSACVFSGSKSLHFLVSVTPDIPSIKEWRKLAEWMLNICTMADQQTKNPTRSIRIPGAIRPETGKTQDLVEFKGPVQLEELMNWLRLHPEAEPKERQKRPSSGELDPSRLPNWVADRLINGFDPTKGRNQTWFAISVEFGLACYCESDTIDILSRFFTPDPDFKEKEWLTAIHSGFQYVEDGKAK
jgi:hypothetical protein